MEKILCSTFKIDLSQVSTLRILLWFYFDKQVTNKMYFSKLKLLLSEKDKIRKIQIKI